MAEQVDVKMGEYAVATDDTVIASLGVGSCVAVSLYHDDTSTGGLAHVMLPTENGHKSEKHADVLIEELLEEMHEEDLENGELEAKIFGGAHMVRDSLGIGDKNVESVKEILDDEGIDITAEDTGGERGRAVWLHCRSGEVVVRTSFEGTRRY
ncbi:MAG: chemotaxis protein CheD [Candidatus Nanohaloarchaea archaeon]|nr:chemotaxis protein CheD [Candidatus Nanohaloarchaea archaeon]